MSNNDRLPTSGEDYLRMVKAQARACPDVIVAKASHAQVHLAVKNTSSKYRTDWMSCKPAPEGYAPTAEWKDQFMKEFRLARASLMRYKDGQGRSKRRKTGLKEAELHNTSPSSLSSSSSLSSTSSRISASLDNQRIPQVQVVPNVKDERGWRILIYGSDTVKQASTSISDMSLVAKQGDSMAQIQATSAASSIPESQGKPPTPHFLLKLNQGHLIVLLRFFLRWLAENDVTEQEGRWMYALLMKLDPLVESDQVAVLRNLAKKCSRIRSHLNSDSGNKLATVNMVITIVNQQFGQGDLE
ncbi:MAG: survival motor neuron interacting protein 1-domain-containing protein [Podila humilis]|nr:MAG: survival motor neuron interacting protein 1-domain-containing protein [Podila humilis]